MSRTQHSERSNREYWTSRGGKRHGEEPGPFTKRKTHRKERQAGKAQTRDET